MSPSILGLIFAFLFVTIESAQFVYFGGLFQQMDLFQFGFLVFGLIALVFIGWAAIFNPQQLKTAFSMPRQLIAVNLGALVTFSAYLMSVQLLEPAITYTISSGTMPITAYVLYRLGVREGEPMRNGPEAVGNLLIFLSIIFLAMITVLGYSGFVRGDSSKAILGILLAITDGIFFTLILVYSQRLNKAGVQPAVVLGIRLPLYVLVTGFVAYGAGRELAPLDQSEIVFFVLLGFLLTVPPLYFLQKAVSMLTTLTISAITALGPFIIFMLQMVEGRIDYSQVTLMGLTIYIIGAILASWGAVKATASRAV